MTMNRRQWLYSALMFCGAVACKENRPDPPPPDPPPHPPPPPPPDPPWPQAPDYDGRLIGTSCYELIKYPIEEIEWFLRELVGAEGNATELFPVTTWGDTWQWQPYVIDREEREMWKDKPWNPDPNHAFPVFDLNRWNEAVWDKWRQVLSLCQKMNITVVVRVQDYCSRKDNYLERHWAFWSCVQSWRWGGSMHGGYLHWPPGDGGAGNAEFIWPYYDRLNERLIAELDNSGVKYYMEPWNELLVEKGEDWPEDSPDEYEANHLIHKWFADSFIRHGCPAGRIICNPGQGPNDFDSRLLTMAGKMRSFATIEIHGCASPEAMRERIEHYGAGRKTFPNGDGPDKYAKGINDGRPGYTEASPEQAREMGRLIKANNLFGYIYKNRSMRGATTLKKADFSVVSNLCPEL